MHNNALWETEEGTHIRVLVKPKSASSEFIAGVSDNALVVNLRSPAREGKANTELLKRLSKVLSISTGDIRLVSGHKSREKTLVIMGKRIEDVKRALFKLTDSSV
ncbi:MAG: DUF167 domain-containing protein [Candidatus Thorarchaeota archaeon]